MVLNLLDLIQFNSLQGFNTMALLTITQYAKQYNVSKQSVYDRLKRGTLKATIQDGVKMIDTDDLQGVTMDTSNDKLDSQAMVVKEVKRAYKQVIKQQSKLIKRLEKDLEYCRSSRDENYNKLERLFNKLYSNEPQIIDTTVVKKKKKKKK